MLSKKKGFTLLEMLLVIAIIAVLAAIVIVAINPARQLAQARNAQRASDLIAIHKAVQQYYIDNKNWPPPDEFIPDELTDICDTGGDTEPPDCLDLGDDVLVSKYLSALPQNPGGENYKIAMNSVSRKIALTAPGSNELGLLGVVLGTSTDALAHSGGGDSDPECDDGEDNDEDGDIDYDEGYGDPGCESDNDDSENSNNVDLPECNDGIDNDNDGRTDYIQFSINGDWDCDSYEDDNESSEEPMDHNGTADLAITVGDGYNVDQEYLSPALEQDREAERSYRFTVTADGGGIVINSLVYTVVATPGSTSPIEDIITEVITEIDGGDLDNFHPVSGDSTATITMETGDYEVMSGDIVTIDLITGINSYPNIANFESYVTGFKITGVTVNYVGQGDQDVSSTELVNTDSGEKLLFTNPS